MLWAREVSRQTPQGRILAVFHSLHPPLKETASLAVGFRIWNFLKGARRLSCIPGLPGKRAKERRVGSDPPMEGDGGYPARLFKKFFSLSMSSVEISTNLTPVR